MKVETLDAFNAFAARFASQIAPHPSRATLVALSGDLGAGKTTFVQAVAKALGIEAQITSPTFVIEKIYPLEHQRFQRLVHIDAYRLSSADELEVLGWKETAADPGNLIFLEWPERVPELVPEGAIRIRFDIAEQGRTISIDGEEKN